MISKWMTALGAVGLVACAPIPDFRGNFVEPSVVGVVDQGPMDAPDGTCWGRDETPATVETRTQIILKSPEQRTPDGTVVRQATYETIQSQRIVDAREDIWFETPCPDQIDAEFVMALQRALAVRGYFQEDASGIVDAATVASIRAFQQTLDLNSGQLSLVAARRLGLVAYSREDIRQF